MLQQFRTQLDGCNGRFQLMGYRRYEIGFCNIQFLKRGDILQYDQFTDLLLSLFTRRNNVHRDHFPFIILLFLIPIYFEVGICIGIGNLFKEFIFVI